MKKALATLALVVGLALPASAQDCGPAVWTNTTDQAVTVHVQVGEGYQIIDTDPGETVTRWEATPGRSWAVWDTAGTVLAQGVQCGVEPIVVDGVVVTPEPEVKETQPVTPVTRHVRTTPAGVRLI